jgi:uncharacterized membrane protein
VQYITAFIYAVGSIVCHQIPERSFHISGIQLPVCARCTGLYIGGAVGLLLWLLRRDRALRSHHARRALIIAAVPTAVTLITAQLGWWDPANPLRAISAAPLGLVVGVTVAAGLTQNLR